MGVVDAAAGLLAQMGGGNVFAIYTAIVWASVLFSAFIDNIPYVATMLPVVTSLAAGLGIDPTVLYFGLLSGATPGRQLHPHRRFGQHHRHRHPAPGRPRGQDQRLLPHRHPFTLSAVIPAYIYLWLMYAYKNSSQNDRRRGPYGPRRF